MTNEKIDILIIYRDGEEKIIEDINDYGIVESKNCFYCIYRGHRMFIPMENVKFFGYEEGYNKTLI